MVAQELAIRFPERVRALVLAGATPSKRPDATSVGAVIRGSRAKTSCVRRASSCRL